MNQKQKEYKREYFARRYKELYKPAYDEFITLYPFTTDDLPGEEWLPIPNYADYHESNFGRTKSFKKGNVTILTPCVDTSGYLFIGLYKDGESKKFKVHRLVALCFLPNPDNKPEINHRDGNKFNNHGSNLEWVTPAENVQHAFTTGLNVSSLGCDVHNAAFKDEAAIIYIRDNPDHLTREQLADMFNTTPQTISNVQTGKSYPNEGGNIRESQRRLTPEEKADIRRLYVKGSKEFGSYALAKMFSCSKPAILNIINS